MKNKELCDLKDALLQSIDDLDNAYYSLKFIARDFRLQRNSRLRTICGQVRRFERSLIYRVRRIDKKLAGR